jgi:tripartite-type tricarboxylate transporter receptor subunit TctC
MAARTVKRLPRSREEIRMPPSPFVAAALAVAFAAVAPAALAQAYPAKPVTVIVPQSPGGANDTVARVVMAKFSETLGQQFVIENRTGAGGNVGTGAAAKAPKDGYTLLLTVGSSHTINPALYKNAGFDPIKDFEPISLVATAPYVLVVNPSVPANNVAELITWVKAQPQPVNYASAGNGTLNHLFAEMFRADTGLALVHIPYKAAAASVTDVVSGQIPLTFASLPAATPFVRSGKLRLLGVAQEKRSALIPDTPTIGETVKGFGAISWYGLLAPAGTPKAIVDRLAAETRRVLALPDVKDRMNAAGAEPATNTPEQFATLIREELPRWARIVKASGAQVD